MAQDLVNGVPTRKAFPNDLEPAQKGLDSPHGDEAIARLSGAIKLVREAPRRQKWALLLM